MRTHLLEIAAPFQNIQFLHTNIEKNEDWIKSTIHYHTVLHLNAKLYVSMDLRSRTTDPVDWMRKAHAIDEFLDSFFLPLDSNWNDEHDVPYKL